MTKTIAVPGVSNSYDNLLRVKEHEAIPTRTFKTVIPLVLSCVIAVSAVLTGCGASKIEEHPPSAIQSEAQPAAAHLGGGTFNDGVWHLNLTASNDPKMYLDKSHVDLERWSDWAHYTPLVDKVNQIIAGKKTAHDKALAIATYVSTFKPYNLDGSVAKDDGTVVDIYNEPVGVCLDAAILTVAMLRLADIPARVIYPNSWPHAYAQAYLDEKWVGVDDTFGSPLQFSLNLTNIPATSIHWGEVPSVNLNDILPGDPNHSTTVRNVSLSYRELVSSNNSGQVTYPSSTKTVYADAVGHNLSYSEQNYPEGISKGPISLVFTTNSLLLDSFSLDSLYYSIPIPPQNDYHFIGQEVGLEGWGTDTNDMRPYPFFLQYDGYITTSLPEGNYRLECGMRGAVFSASTAYADITIKQGQNLVITEGMFKKPDTASDSDFNITMRTLFNKNN